MKIQVTEEDIRLGEKRNAYACPISRALTRNLGTGVGVCAGWVAIGEKLYRIPREASDFVQRFDSLVEVEPFEFEFEQGEALES